MKPAVPLFGDTIKKPETEPDKSPGYLAVNSKFREAAEVLTRRTGVRWEPAEAQETIWSWAKALLEKTESAGEDRTTSQILEAGELTHEMINSVPDFEVLFLENTYRNILEEGGYGEGIRHVERDVKSSSGDGGNLSVRGNASTSEGSGITEDAFRGHLKTAAERIEKVRRRRSGKTERSDNWWGDRKKYAGKLAYGEPKGKPPSPYRGGDNKVRRRVAGLDVTVTSYKPTLEFVTHQGYSGDSAPSYLELSGKNAPQVYHNAISESVKSPLHGAWIETYGAERGRERHLRHTPRGGCELKLMATESYLTFVARE